MYRVSEYSHCMKSVPEISVNIYTLLFAQRDHELPNPVNLEQSRIAGVNRRSTQGLHCFYALGASSQVIPASDACTSHSEEFFFCAEISVINAFICMNTLYIL